MLHTHFYVQYKYKCILQRLDHKTYKLTPYEKTHIIQKITLIFYHRAVVKQDHYVTHLLSYANIVLWWRRCKIHNYVAAINIFVHLHYKCEKIKITSFTLDLVKDAYIDWIRKGSFTVIHHWLYTIQDLHCHIRSTKKETLLPDTNIGFHPDILSTHSKEVWLSQEGWKSPHPLPSTHF